MKLLRGITDRRPNLSDTELVEAVRRAGGVVSIGFRPPAAPRTRESGVVPGMSRGAALEARQAVVRGGATLLATFRHSSAVVARIRPEYAPVLGRLPFVDFVEPEVSGTPAQSLPPQDTGWGVWKVGAPWVWASLGIYGQGASIWMLDTGLDSTHWWNWYLDGPNGYWASCMYPEWYVGSCYQDFEHGSMVAGVISGRDNAYGVIGIAPYPLVFRSVRVCRVTTSYPPRQECSDQAVAYALDWAIHYGQIEPGRQIVNMSIQWCEGSGIVEEYVARAAAAGMLLVAAVGNRSKECSGNPTGVLFPALYPEVIAVSGTTSSDLFADYPFRCPNGNDDGSRYGDKVELSAPFEARSMSSNGDWKAGCGTSLAAPVVTAVAALLWTQHPEWNAAQVRQRLAATAADLGPSGRDQKFGFGRVDAFWALLPPAPPSAWASVTGPAEVRLYSTCTWYASTSLTAQPLVYEWTVDGRPTGGNDPTLVYSAGTGSFTIAVAIRDALGAYVFDDHVVTVSPGAAECLDQ